jgi:hypothetical protein
MKMRTVVIAIIGFLGAVFVFTACGSSGKDGTSSTASENTFKLGEFTIVPPSNTLSAGNVSITADNIGGEEHELVIVRAPSKESLPTKSDGSVDEDKIAEADKIGEIEDVAAQSSKTKTFELAAGKYVAFCNIIDSMMGSSSTMMGGHSDMMGDSGMGSGTGHVHFAAGMHVEFTVD